MISRADLAVGNLALGGGGLAMMGIGGFGLKQQHTKASDAVRVGLVAGGLGMLAGAVVPTKIGTAPNPWAHELLLDSSCLAVAGLGVAAIGAVVMAVQGSHHSSGQ
jgi:hypothetical protein